MSEDSKRGCFFYGCLGVVGFAILFIGIVVAVFMYGRSSVNPVADKFFAHVDRNEYKQAYAMLGDMWTKTMDYEGFVDFEEQVKGVLGKCKERTLTSFNMNSGAQGTFCKAVYSADFENGSAILTFTMQKKNDKWVIQGLHYGSDKLLELLKCPHCGFQNKAMGKFCAKCGKPMRPDIKKPKK